MLPGNRRPRTRCKNLKDHNGKHIMDYLIKVTHSSLLQIPKRKLVKGVRFHRNFFIVYIKVTTHSGVQIYSYLHSYPEVTMVSRSVEYYHISAVDSKSSHSVSVHVIIECEAGKLSISRYSEFKLCIITGDSGGRRFDVHIVPCEEEKENGINQAFNSRREMFSSTLFIRYELVTYWTQLMF